MKIRVIFEAASTLKYVAVPTHVGWITTGMLAVRTNNGWFLPKIVWCTIPKIIHNRSIWRALHLVSALSEFLATATWKANTVI